MKAFTALLLSGIIIFVLVIGSPTFAFDIPSVGVKEENACFAGSGYGVFSEYYFQIF